MYAAIKDPYCYDGTTILKNLPGLKNKNDLTTFETVMTAQRAASFLADVNAVHPFREGNGRTQNTFLAMVAEAAEHPLDLEKLNADNFLEAMIKSHLDNEQALTAEIKKLIR